VSIQKGERWLCQNDACGSEILVVESSKLRTDENPRCTCGSIMKKPYVRPEVSVFKARRDIVDRSAEMVNEPFDPYKMT
jgi:hypothetical protein